MSIAMSRTMKIAADNAAAHDHVDDPATPTHQIVAAQIWRTLKALGNQGGHILTIGDGCGALLGLPPGIGPEHGSAIARVDRHGNAIGPISDMNRWDEHEPFDVVLATLTGYDVRLTYAPNIVRRRADQVKDTTLAVAVTKPGGFTAVIATHDLMDNPVPFGRRQIGDFSDLVGAVRFPAGIYRPATGTDEVADLLVFRRREPDAERRGAGWEEATAVELDGGMVFVNTYFDTNVDQVLGSTQLDPTGRPPTNLTVVGSRALFPGHLASALDDVIAYAQCTGLTAGRADTRRRGNAGNATRRAPRPPTAPLSERKAPRPDGTHPPSGPHVDTP